mmetsp:Transcript_25964/g.21865  ORF Transcript_25964/g.21865 Transcript_25964/m.21865 type:complete len:158 (+) Transcript_25964:76-549(+)
MVQIWPPIHGCGRDSYIHMRDDVRFGRSGAPNSGGHGVPLSRAKTPTSGLMREKDLENRKVQLESACRLASPSPRQLRIAAENSNLGDKSLLKQLRIAMPFSPGVTLAERERTIKTLHRDHFSASGSPVPRTPASPMLLKSGRSPYSASFRGPIQAF